MFHENMPSLLSSFNQNFNLSTDIGSGHFSVVKKCQRKTDGEVFAAKCIQKRGANGMSSYSSSTTLEDIRREIDVLLLVENHENIIKFYEAYDRIKDVVLLFECLEGGELFEYLSDKEKLSEDEASKFTKQILSGLQYIHERNVIHLDIKPDNLLLKNRQSDCPLVKIVDFGCAQMVKPGQEVRVMSGTPEFIAPEIISFDPISCASDTWSLGVTCYILLSGYSPFAGNDDQETYNNIASLNYKFNENIFAETSNSAKQFIRNLLQLNPRSRMLTDDCLSHPWIKPKDKSVKVRRRATILKNNKRLREFTAAKKRWKKGIALMMVANKFASVGNMPVSTKINLSTKDEDLKNSPASNINESSPIKKSSNIIEPATSSEKQNPSIIKRNVKVKMAFSRQLSQRRKNRFMASSSTSPSSPLSLSPRSSTQLEDSSIISTENVYSAPEIIKDDKDGLNQTPTVFVYGTDPNEEPQKILDSSIYHMSPPPAPGLQSSMSYPSIPVSEDESISISSKETTSRFNKSSPKRIKSVEFKEETIPEAAPSRKNEGRFAAIRRMFSIKTKSSLGTKKAGKNAGDSTNKRGENSAKNNKENDAKQSTIKPMRLRNRLNKKPPSTTDPEGHNMSTSGKNSPNKSPLKNSNSTGELITSHYNNKKKNDSLRRRPRSRNPPT